MWGTGKGKRRTCQGRQRGCGCFQAQSAGPRAPTGQLPHPARRGAGGCARMHHGACEQRLSCGTSPSCWADASVPAQRNFVACPSHPEAAGPPLMLRPSLKRMRPRRLQLVHLPRLQRPPQRHRLQAAGAPGWSMRHRATRHLTSPAPLPPFLPFPPFFPLPPPAPATTENSSSESAAAIFGLGRVDAMPCPTLR